jgi:hypothetical protein
MRGLLIQILIISFYGTSPIKKISLFFRSFEFIFAFFYPEFAIDSNFVRFTILRGGVFCLKLDGLGQPVRQGVFADDVVIHSHEKAQCADLAFAIFVRFVARVNKKNHKNAETRISKREWHARQKRISRWVGPGQEAFYQLLRVKKAVGLISAYFNGAARPGKNEGFVDKAHSNVYKTVVFETAFH